MSAAGQYSSDPGETWTTARPIQQIDIEYEAPCAEIIARAVSRLSEIGDSIDGTQATNCRKRLLRCNVVCGSQPAARGRLSEEVIDVIDPARLCGGDLLGISLQYAHELRQAEPGRRSKLTSAGTARRLPQLTIGVGLHVVIRVKNESDLDVVLPAG